MQREDFLYQSYISQLEGLKQLASDAEVLAKNKGIPPRGHTEELFKTATRLYLIAEKFVEAGKKNT